MPIDDRELLLATRRGCDRSARALWSRHAPRLLAFARAIVGEAHAPDAVQSVFCSIMTIDRARLAEVRDVGAYLVTATRRSALNSLRAIRRERARRESAPLRLVPSDAHPEDDLAAAIDLLPRRQREVLVLKHVAGMTFDQIGRALGVPRDTAAGRYRAGLAALRSALTAGAPEQEAIDAA